MIDVLGLAAMAATFLHEDMCLLPADGGFVILFDLEQRTLDLDSLSTWEATDAQTPTAG